LKIFVYIVFSLLLLSNYSCDYLNFKNKDVSEEIVASVGPENLYKSDLTDLYDVGMNAEDSTLVTNNFIEIWAKKQIYLQKAALNLPEEKETALEKMVDEYRDDLFTNSYKEALVEQNLDTIIADEAIRNFYIANQNIFKLNKELLKYRSLCFNTNAMNTKEIKTLFLDSSTESVENILEEELKYSRLQLNDSTWYSFSDILKSDVFFKNIDKNKMLTKNHFIMLTDSVNTYFFMSKDVLHRNEIAPLEYVRPVIKQMILHKKKLQFLKTLEEQLIQEAINNNTYIKQ